MKKITLPEAIRDIKWSCENAGKAPFFFIVGSGISAPNVPVASVMIEELKDKAIERGITDTLKGEENPLNVYSYWFNKAFPDRIDRQKYLRELIEGTRITPANMSLAHLVSERKISNLVVTTNFDDFFSRALALFGFPHLTFDHPVTTARILPGDDKDIKIVHVHGSYLFYDCCNLKSEVKGRAEYSKVSIETMADFLDRFMLYQSPIVIGYSGWEGDVIMTSLKKRLQATLPLPRPLYWFCYRREEADCLPDWLRNNSDVCFVLPPEKKSEVKRVPNTPAGGAGMLELSAPSEGEDVLSAEKVFYALKMSFDLKTPPILKDPLGTFARRLRKSFPAHNETQIKEDVYIFKECIANIEKAKELLESEPSSDDVSKLQEVLDYVRRAKFSEAVDVATAININILEKEQLSQLFSSLVSVAEGLWHNLGQELRAYDLIISYGAIMESQKIMTPELQEKVARSLFNKGVALREIGRDKDAVKVYDEVIKKYGSSKEPYLIEHVVGAFFNKGNVLVGIGRDEDAVKTYDEVVVRYGGSEAEDPALKERVAGALFNKGVALVRLGRDDDAVMAYDEAVRRYGGSDEPSLKENVAKALVNKGVALGRLGRDEDAVKAYDEVVKRYGGLDDPALKERVAGALSNKAVTLVRLGRDKDAIKACDELVARCGGFEEPSLKERVAGVLVNKGNALGRLGRGEDAVKTYDEVIHKYGDSEEPSLKENVAMALFNKGNILGRLGRGEDGIKTYDEVIHRYGDSEDLFLKEMVAKALFNKGFALVSIGKRKDGFNAYDEIIKRYRDTEEPSLMEKVARSFTNKGLTLVRMGKYGDGRECFSRAVGMCQEGKDVVIQLNHISALAGLGRLDEAMSVFDKLLERGGIDDKGVASGFLDDLNVLAESDGAPEAMNEFYEYAKKKLG